MKLVQDTFGTDAIELPGYLFYHATALEYECCNFEVDCTKYPTLSLSDAEVDQLKLKSVDFSKVKPELGFAIGVMGTSFYKSFGFPIVKDESDLVDTIIGQSTIRKESI